MELFFVKLKCLNFIVCICWTTEKHGVVTEQTLLRSCSASESVQSLWKRSELQLYYRTMQIHFPGPSALSASFFSLVAQRQRGWGRCSLTDRRSRWLTDSPVLIHFWLSLQLFLTRTRWPNHRATAKAIWLRNSHKWLYILGTPSEQHTNTSDTRQDTNSHLITWMYRDTVRNP